jgi:uncharacterized membrane protein
MEVNYLLLKMLHILGGIIFVGNIIVTAFWKIMADRTREPAIAAFGQRLVNSTDFAFTSLGAFILLITGLMMTYSISEDLWSIAWVAWGLGLFLASGAVWALVLFPVQVKQSWLARSFAEDGEIPDRYWRLGRIWLGFAVLATLLPLLNLYFMVYKPG